MNGYLSYFMEIFQMRISHKNIVYKLKENKTQVYK